RHSSHHWPSVVPDVRERRRPACEGAALRDVRTRYSDTRIGNAERMAERPLDFMGRCADISGAAIGEGAFSPRTAIWIGKREIAARPRKADSWAGGQKWARAQSVEFRTGRSDWLRVRVPGEPSLDRALELVRDPVEANPATADSGLPPGGAELARRRRFH